MYRITVCDDSEEQLKIINDYVLRYNSEFPDRFFSPALFNNPLEFMGTAEKREAYDVLLLDIFMPGISGIELAKELRLHSSSVQLIFVTTTREFAVEAIALKSTHYLIKPFSYEKLKEALDRAFENLEVKNSRTVALKSRSGEIYTINVGDVISVECYGHIQRVYCKGCSFELRDGIETLTRELFDKRFFSTHKGIYVNMDSIVFVGADFLKTSDGRSLPISKRTMPEFKRRYLDRTVGS